MKSKYHWNEDAATYFKFNSNYQSKGETIAEIALYVEVECSFATIEDEQKMIDELTNIVFPAE